MRGFVLTPHPHPPVDFRALGLPEDAENLFDLVDGVRTVADIIDESPLDATRTFQVFFCLIVLEQFDKIDPGAVGRDADRDLPETAPGLDVLTREALREEEKTEETDDDEFEIEDDTAPADAAAEVSDADLSDRLTRALDDFFVEADGEADDEAGEEADVEITVDLDGADADLLSPPAEESGDDAEGEAPAALTTDEELLRERILKLYLSLDKATHYEVLDVGPGVPTKHVKAAYNDFVKVMHPDRLPPSFSPEIVEKASAVMARATDAYRILSDLKQRREYDKRLTSKTSAKERTVQMILAAEQAFNAGALAVKQMDWLAARKHFSEAIELFPEEAEYHAYLGWTIYNQPGQPLGERTNQARALLEKALQMNPRSDKAYYFLGRLLKDAGVLEKAAIMFAQAFRHNKNNNEAKRELKYIQSLRTRQAPGGPSSSGQKKKQKPATAKDLLQKDVSFDTVKKSILKIFW
ncbi:MAG: DnaJ domain-containing protein [Deltaproteobacteria bacterium]|nr:DnaJ domain-containing protein [Deltaproteobacteria bacterium]